MAGVVSAKCGTAFEIRGDARLDHCEAGAALLVENADFAVKPGVLRIHLARQIAQLRILIFAAVAAARVNLEQHRFSAGKAPARHPI